MFTYNPFVSTPSVLLRQPDTVHFTISFRIIADFTGNDKLIGCFILT